MQQVLLIKTLPESGLDASAQFVAAHLPSAREILEAPECSSLVITLPTAAFDHDDWRTSLARDLARQFAPKRVNVVGASDPAQAKDLLAYLEDAPGVTGQYLAAHE